MIYDKSNLCTPNWQKCHYQFLSQREDQFACEKVETQQRAIVIAVFIFLKCYSMISYGVRSEYETITYFTSTRILMHHLILVHNIFDIASQKLFPHIFFLCQTNSWPILFANITYWVSKWVLEIFITTLFCCHCHILLTGNL